MNTHTTKIGLAAAVIVGGLALSGCVSTDTFNAHVDASNATHASLGSRLDALDGKVAANAQAAAAAQATADQALKGKFVMTEVARESVNFSTGSSTLSNEAKATLTALADRLKSENKNVSLEIRGHTDMRGGKLANRQLGRERAANTARFLVDQGVPGTKLQVGSWGEDVPVAGKEDDLAENRRVDIIVLQ